MQLNDDQAKCQTDVCVITKKAVRSILCLSAKSSWNDTGEQEEVREVEDKRIIQLWGLRASILICNWILLIDRVHLRKLC